MINNERWPIISITTLNNDPKKFYVVALQDRWGTGTFCHEIEFKHFHPNIIDLNKQFNIKYCPSKHGTYNVIEVPTEYEGTVKKIADLIGMKVCDGIPTDISMNGERSFFPFEGKPFNGNNVWTLENDKRPLYHMPPFITEEEECKRIRNGESPISFL